MYSSVCKSVGNNDKDIATFIVNGLLEALKVGGIVFLSIEQHYEILNFVKTEMDIAQATEQPILIVDKMLSTLLSKLLSSISVEQ